MANLFLTNDSLTKFVEDLGISSEKKSLLLAKIPELDEEERKKLLICLKNVYLLDLEEGEAIARLEKNWK